MEKTILTAELREKLFLIIRAGLDKSIVSLDFTSTDCKELMKVGTRQSILPIIHRGLKNSCAPTDVIKECDKARLKDTKQYILQNDAMNKIEAALEGEQIPFIPLKGAVLRHLYPSPELRTSSDIDVLVHEDDLETAVAAIEKVTDLKTLKKAYHDVSMVNSNVHLELHFTIKVNSDSLDCLLKRAWEYAEPVEGSRYTFTPEFQAFHVIAHMSHHFTHGGLGIRPFLDLWLLRNRTIFDEEAVRQMCSECGILKFYKESCDLAAIWLGDGEHTETTKILEDFCLSGGVFGSARFENAGRQRNKRGWKYIISRVFPPAYQVKEYYRDESGKEHTLVYYYGKRMLSWFGKGAELKNQMQAVLSSDTEYLNFTDDLFKRLEL